MAVGVALMSVSRPELFAWGTASNLPNLAIHLAECPALFPPTRHSLPFCVRVRVTPPDILTLALHVTITLEIKLLFYTYLSFKYNLI